MDASKAWSTTFFSAHGFMDRPAEQGIVVGLRSDLEADVVAIIIIAAIKVQDRKESCLAHRLQLRWNPLGQLINITRPQPSRPFGR